MEKRGVHGTEYNSKSQEQQPSSAATRMRHAVNSAAIAAGGNAVDELDAAAKALVTELRLANEPPEQVLLQIKRILADAGLHPGHGLADPTIIVERHVTLYRNVIASSIRHYFATNDDQDPSPA